MKFYEISQKEFRRMGKSDTISEKREQDDEYKSQNLTKRSNVCKHEKILVLKIFINWYDWVWKVGNTDKEEAFYCYFVLFSYKQ